MFLSHNSVGNAGAEKIADALRHNDTLQKLSLSDNEIGNAGAGRIADALRYDNITLQELHLFQGDNISVRIMHKIMGLVRINYESTQCSRAEIALRKRAEFGPTLDEIYFVVRSKPYLLF